MAKDVTTVKILDSNYKIACPADEAEAVKQAAVFLDKKLREIKELLSALNLDIYSVYLNQKCLIRFVFLNFVAKYFFQFAAERTV
mgnify:CR=1 FL=1